MGNYAAWAQNYATGVAAAESKTVRNRRAAQKLAVANRAAGAKRPCGIKGCERHSYKGQLCRKHWAMVPAADKVGLMIACMEAQRKEAERQHRRFLRELRMRLA